MPLLHQCQCFSFYKKKRDSDTAYFFNAFHNRQSIKMMAMIWVTLMKILMMMRVMMTMTMTQKFWDSNPASSGSGTCCDHPQRSHRQEEVGKVTITQSDDHKTRCDPVITTLGRMLSPHVITMLLLQIWEVSNPQIHQDLSLQCQEQTGL